MYAGNSLPGERLRRRNSAKNVRTQTSRDGLVMDADACAQRVQKLAAMRDSRGNGLLKSEGLRAWRANLAGNCESPFEQRVLGLVYAYSKPRHQRLAGVRLTEMYRCRKCPPCRDNRRRQWMARASVEYQRSPRTWFVTFTMSPDWQALLGAKAHKLWRGEVAPTSAELLDLKMRVFKRLVTRWLTVLCGRGETAHKRAYVLVGERHKSGEPHFHALIHEREVEGIFRKEDCEFTKAPKGFAFEEERANYYLRNDSRAIRLWRFGFCQIKLCKDERAAGYCMKYLHKSVAHRIVASQRYGDGRSYCVSYDAYRSSADFEIVRRSALEQAQHACQKCGLMGVPLVVRHQCARFPRFGGEELPSDVVVLCAECDEEARQHPPATKVWMRDAGEPIWLSQWYGKSAKFTPMVGDYESPLCEEMFSPGVEPDG